MRGPDYDLVTVKSTEVYCVRRVGGEEEVPFSLFPMGPIV